MSALRQQAARVQALAAKAQQAGYTQAMFPTEDVAAVAELAERVADPKMRGLIETTLRQNARGLADTAECMQQADAIMALLTEGTP